MAIWVSKELYRSDKLIYGVVNPLNRKKNEPKNAKTEMCFWANSFAILKGKLANLNDQKKCLFSPGSYYLYIDTWNITRSRLQNVIFSFYHNPNSTSTQLKSWVKHKVGRRWFISSKTIV